MRLPWNPRFSEEAAHFDLRYTCPDCGHFQSSRGECAHGWPRADHAARHNAAEPPDAEVVFCKEFELL